MRSSSRATRCGRRCAAGCSLSSSCCSPWPSARSTRWGATSSSTTSSRLRRRSRLGLDARTLAGATLLGLAMFVDAVPRLRAGRLPDARRRPRRRRARAAAAAGRPSARAYRPTSSGGSWPPPRVALPTSPSSSRPPGGTGVSAAWPDHPVASRGCGSRSRVAVVARHLAAGLRVPHRDGEWHRGPDGVRCQPRLGLLGTIGEALNSGHPAARSPTPASWLLPFEALYRDALRLLVRGHPGRHRRDRPARAARRLARLRPAAPAVRRPLRRRRVRRRRGGLRPARPLGAGRLPGQPAGAQRRPAPLPAPGLGPAREGLRDVRADLRRGSARRRSARRSARSPGRPPAGRRRDAVGQRLGVGCS